MVGEEFGVGEIVDAVNFEVGQVNKNVIEFSDVFFSEGVGIAQIQADINKRSVFEK